MVVSMQAGSITIFRSFEKIVCCILSPYRGIAIARHVNTVLVLWEMVASCVPSPRIL